ncbi:Mus7/MMS22 family-domain-containing protein [Crucibulum laeve]|uniref:Mus7/MMS22 family-domain-containing protein n=1 Tax=Crucibulum laeve TaxID=68775 RepID=A0A5C3M3H0_9AGAR|nr:Mus7/MMS22 family-domain-containing protein [Crucibulum laeve]
MGEDEYVETSDVEELAEIQAHDKSDWDDMYLRDEYHSPRKRVKLLHTSESISAQSVAGTPTHLLGGPIFRSSPSHTSPVPPDNMLCSSSQESSSLIHTPTNTYEHHNGPLWHPHDQTFNDIEDEPANSQDPLLLHSSRQSPSPTHKDYDLHTAGYTALSELSNPFLVNGASSRPTTPQRSPACSNRRSHSADPMSLFISPQYRHDILLTSNNTAETLTGDAEQAEDNTTLLFASPRPTPPASNMHLSLLTSPSQRLLRLSPAAVSPTQRMSPRSESNSSPPSQPNSSLLRSRSPSLLAVPLQQPEPLLAAESRYPLRKRQAVQLAPYSVDQLLYKNSLKAAPEAVVKIKSLGHHHRHQHPEDLYEETQEDGYVYDGRDEEEDTEWQEKEKRRQAREEARQTNKSRSPHPAEHFPGLEPLSSDDEEEEKEMRRIRAEVKAMYKKKDAKGKEKHEKKRAKAFPLAEDHAMEHKNAPGSKRRKSHGSENRHSRSPSPGPSTSRRKERTPTSPTHPSTSLFTAVHRASTPPSPSQGAPQDPILQYFGQDGLNVVLFDDDGMNINCDNNDAPLFGQVDVQDQSMGMDVDGPPLFIQGGILRNTRDSPIEITSDEDGSRQSRAPSEERQSSPRAQSASGSDSPEEVVLEGKRLKALTRMYPAFMINDLVKGKISSAVPKKHNRQKSVAASLSGSEAEEAIPLAPGQSRVRRAANPRDIRNIKGDSESSSNSSDESEREINTVDVVSEPDDGIGVYHTSRRQRKCDSGSRRLMKRREDSPEHYQEEISVISDNDIQAYLLDEEEDNNEHQGARMSRREESLIDYMLSRSHTISSRPKFSRKRSHHNKSKANKLLKSSCGYKYDVVTKGVSDGHLRQGRLDFSNHDKQRHSAPKKHDRQDSTHRTATGPSRQRLLEDSGDDEDITHPQESIRLDGVSHIQMEETTKKKTRKQLQKERRARAKKNGLYTFTSGSRLEDGRQHRQTVFVTVDLEDEGFHQAIAPHSQGRSHYKSWADAFQSPSQRRAQPRIRQDEHITDDPHLPDHEDVDVNTKRKHRFLRRDLQNDLNIPLLHVGLSFSSSSFIGKELLFDLIEVLKSPQETRLPLPSSACGFDLCPTMGATRFAEVLPNICDAALEFTTNLPELDRAEKRAEWLLVMRTVCQLVSWFLRPPRPDEEDSDAWREERESLRRAADEQLPHFVAKIHDSVSKDALDSSTFDICWFAFELSVRLGHNFRTAPATSARPTLHSPMWLLVQNLLRFGLHRTMRWIKEEDILESNINTYTAELWVRVLHVANHCSSGIPPNEKQVHPFWQAVLKALESEHEGEKSNLQVSENIWTVIFALCALSQFSVHGSSKAKPCLPACWQLVVFALKKIHLAADRTADQALAQKSLNKRDEYVNLVTTRCILLCDRWQWDLDNAGTLFNSLGEIFRSRKFQNLRHEEPDYPAFMKDGDWELLKGYRAGDTSFITFLKLIVQAANATPGSLTPKVRKLLSLAIPVGSLPFTKKTPPQKYELSMLYNRISAVAVGMFLDPASYVSRIQHARGYIDFSNADVNTRTAVIRGAMLTGILAVKSKFPVDVIVEWLEEIVVTLNNELRDLPETSLEIPGAASDDGRGHLLLNICFFLGAVRHIVDSYLSSNEYPEPTLLASLKVILRSRRPVEAPKLVSEVRSLIEHFLDARARVMLSPERPQRRAAIQEEESQDQYGDGFQFDFDDPAFCAAVDGAVAEAPHNAKEETLRKVISDTNLRWSLLRMAKKYFPDPPSSFKVFNQWASQCDRWMRCWLGCVSVEYRSGNKKTWSESFDLRKSTWGIDNSAFWRRRIDLSFMWNMLKFDPMVYLDFIDPAIDIFIESLVIPGESTIEHEYAAWILTIDALQHPLLRGIDFVEMGESGDYEIAKFAFPEQSLALLKVVFENLNTRLYDEAAQDDPLIVVENQKFIGSLIRLFSLMRDTYESLKKNHPDEFVLYKAQCEKVFALLQDCRQLRSQPRLSFWITWGRSFD